MLQARIGRDSTDLRSESFLITKAVKFHPLITAKHLLLANAYLPKKSSNFDLKISREKNLPHPLVVCSSGQSPSLLKMSALFLTSPPDCSCCYGFSAKKPFSAHNFLSKTLNQITSQASWLGKQIEPYRSLTEGDFLQASTHFGALFSTPLQSFINFYTTWTPEHNTVYQCCFHQCHVNW